MKESMTYQKILADGMAEGRAEGIALGRTKGERLLFLKFATRRLGEPDERTLSIIQAATAEQIGAWMEAILTIENWSELIPT
jgi:hypothetical protein